jgi:hypothetical protein
MENPMRDFGDEHRTVSCGKVSTLTHESIEWRLGPCGFEGEVNVPFDYAMEFGALVVQGLSELAFTFLSRTESA